MACKAGYSKQTDKKHTASEESSFYTGNTLTLNKDLVDKTEKNEGYSPSNSNIPLYERQTSMEGTEYQPLQV
jgi:hypothetical protein